MRRGPPQRAPSVPPSSCYAVFGSRISHQPSLPAARLSETIVVLSEPSFLPVETSSEFAAEQELRSQAESALVQTQTELDAGGQEQRRLGATLEEVRAELATEREAHARLDESLANEGWMVRVDADGVYHGSMMGLRHFDWSGKLVWHLDHKKVDDVRFGYTALAARPGLHRDEHCDCVAV